MMGIPLTATVDVGTFTDAGTSVLTWGLEGATKVVTWVAGNPLALTAFGMFAAGFAVALVVRIVRSVV